MKVPDMSPIALAPKLAAGACPQLLRALSTAGAQSGLLEVREYTLSPSGFKDYVKITQEHASLRKELLPLLGMFTCDIGADLNKITHFYHYKDLAQRDAVRQAAGSNPQWQAYISSVRPHVLAQESSIMSEAWGVYSATSSSGAAGFRAPAHTGATPPVYELRQYQLHPGYGSVPKLLAAFQEGLPEKISADRDGLLVLMAYTEVGLLNNVMELWRYPSAAACIKARQASRVVPKWRETIAAITPGVQHFRSSFLHPTSFSPWK